MYIARINDNNEIQSVQEHSVSCGYAIWVPWA